MKPVWKLSYDFSTFLEDISREVESSLQVASEDISVRAKSLAPVDTGDLRDSYMWEKVEDGRYRIGSNPYRGVYRRGHPTTYAPYVEFGTSRAPAQPHFVPAFELGSDFFVKRLGEALRKKSK